MILGKLLNITMTNRRFMCAVHYCHGLHLLWPNIHFNACCKFLLLEWPCGGTENGVEMPFFLPILDSKFVAWVWVVKRLDSLCVCGLLLENILCKWRPDPRILKNTPWQKKKKSLLVWEWLPHRMLAYKNEKACLSSHFSWPRRRNVVATGQTTVLIHSSRKRLSFGRHSVVGGYSGNNMFIVDTYSTWILITSFISFTLANYFYSFNQTFPGI